MNIPLIFVHRCVLLKGVSQYDAPLCWAKGGRESRPPSQLSPTALISTSPKRGETMFIFCAPCSDRPSGKAMVVCSSPKGGAY